MVQLDEPASSIPWPSVDPRERPTGSVDRTSRALTAGAIVTAVGVLLTVVLVLLVPIVSTGAQQGPPTFHSPGAATYDVRPGRYLIYAGDDSVGRPSIGPDDITVIEDGTALVLAYDNGSDRREYRELGTLTSVAAVTVPRVGHVTVSTDRGGEVITLAERSDGVSTADGLILATVAVGGLTVLLGIALIGAVLARSTRRRWRTVYGL